MNVLERREKIRATLSSIDTSLMAVWLELGHVHDAGYLADIEISAEELDGAASKLLDYISAAVA